MTALRRPSRDHLPTNAVTIFSQIVGTASSCAPIRGPVRTRDEANHRSDNETMRRVRISITTSVTALVLGTAILAFITQFMTGSIGNITQQYCSGAFVGIVLLPILSSDLTAFENAALDKIGVAIQSALGRSLQTTLLVMPATVLVA